MTIRPAAPKDFSKIKALIRLYPDRLMQNPLPKLREFFVAQVRGEIAGCCALEVYSRRLAEVRSLAVAPGFQRRGIGTALVKACLHRAKRHGIHEVLSISAAVGLFGALGFATFNRQKYGLFKVLKK